MKTEIFEKNMKKWENSMHFLKPIPYTKIMMKINKNGKECNMSYIDVMKNSERMPNWYHFYAMNWVSQINFFHRYMNNRVILVTGSTGVGKSTQIPRLLMYALKVIDYKNDGKILCSQPRLAPTRNSAITISYQMGVPIYNNKQKYIRYIANR